jgi:protein TonB
MKQLFLLLVLLTTTMSFSQNSDGENEANEEKEFKIAITNPQFEGGTPALSKFLSDNLQFSEADMGGLSKAKVYVNFTVTKSGEITDVSVGKGVNEALDKEAVRIIKSMPYWIPGTQNGERVSLKMTLPINFVIM